MSHPRSSRHRARKAKGYMWDLSAHTFGVSEAGVGWGE